MTENTDFPVKLEHEQNFTLKNGTIVTNEYARRRIVTWLAKHKIPLVDRQLLAYTVVNDTWHAHCLVTFLQVVALELWLLDWQLQSETYQGSNNE